MNPKYFALWTDRHGRNCWAGPFAKNTVAIDHLVHKVMDKSGGYMVVQTMAMTPAEVREAPVYLKTGE
jgi:hypothetical protein